ncbi:MAG: NAD-dependent epimerase/dehydratase family protein [Chthoniobacterales bacterium]|nr:NAD-dependent epimerase/dehydratase family protein [Chthoniobacterales bacterium]
MPQKLLITGICGFVGYAVAQALKESHADLELVGIDNFIRPGSELNRASLKRLGVQLFHGDLRSASDLEQLPAVDGVIDAAANPSVLAGVDGKTSSRQLVEHNLSGTINLLEYCKRHQATFILLSTSRVYSIPPLAALPVKEKEGAFCLEEEALLPVGVSRHGVDESFSTEPPLSLYGSTKRASELLALEYGESFDFPVLINRCGVLAGAGQFGRADQGIFSYWINSYLRRKPLQYIGFEGSGYQVRDCLHPRDVAALISRQLLGNYPSMKDRVVNCSGGRDSAMSLQQLSTWCSKRFGAHEIVSSKEIRTFDIPWMVLDSKKAAQVWGWKPTMSTEEILEEIACHAEVHPEWLELSAPF